MFDFRLLAIITMFVCLIIIAVLFVVRYGQKVVDDLVSSTSEPLMACRSAFLDATTCLYGEDDFVRDVMIICENDAFETFDANAAIREYDEAHDGELRRQVERFNFNQTVLSDFTRLKIAQLTRQTNKEQYEEYVRRVHGFGSLLVSYGAYFDSEYKQSRNIVIDPITDLDLDFSCRPRNSTECKHWLLRRKDLVRVLGLQDM